MQAVLVDGGYAAGDPFFVQAIFDRLGVTVQLAKRNESHHFAVIPQRWVFDMTKTPLKIQKS